MYIYTKIYLYGYIHKQRRTRVRVALNVCRFKHFFFKQIALTYEISFLNRFSDTYFDNIIKEVCVA